ncbi:MAG: EamA/RhaT family transporter [Flavobacteriales bacterium]
MIYLLLSILTNAAIYWVFKWFDRFGVQTLPAIVVNYFVACTIGLIVVPDLKGAVSAASQLPVWTVGGLSLGIVFISVFYLTGSAARTLGVSVATIASKMSLALAVLLFVWIDPTEQLHVAKVVAILLAMSGVYFSSLKDDGGRLSIQSLGLPILILLGSTAVDFGIAHFSSFPKGDNELKLFSCLSFAMAGVCGAAVIAYQILKGKMKLTTRDIVGGIALGTVNYGSILFLVLAYDSDIMQKSELLPVNNLGVVLVSALAAIVFFKEKLSRYNWLGVALSVVALALLL